MMMKSLYPELQKERNITEINLNNFVFENRKVIYESDKFRDTIPNFDNNCF